MTFSRLRRLGILLWCDIARNYYKNKQESKYYHYVKFIYHSCPFCVYYFSGLEFGGCMRCPLKMCNGKKKNNLYGKWLNEKNLLKRQKYANEIKNLFVNWMED